MLVVNLGSASGCSLRWHCHDRLCTWKTFAERLDQNVFYKDMSNSWSVYWNSPHPVTVTTRNFQRIGNPNPNLHLWVLLGGGRPKVYVTTCYLLIGGAWTSHLQLIIGFEAEKVTYFQKAEFVTDFRWFQMLFQSSLIKMNKEPDRILTVDGDGNFQFDTNTAHITTYQVSCWSSTSQWLVNYFIPVHSFQSQRDLTGKVAGSATLTAASKRFFGNPLSIWKMRLATMQWKA